MEKQPQGSNRGEAKAIDKRKHKIGRVKLGRFVAVSVYDLVTWVGIALCVGFVLIYGFQHNQRGLWWSLAVLMVLVVIMLAIRAIQHFGDNEVEVETNSTPSIDQAPKVATGTISTPPPIRRTTVQ